MSRYLDVYTYPEPARKNEIRLQVDPNRGSTSNLSPGKECISKTSGLTYPSWVDPIREEYRYRHQVLPFRLACLLEVRG